MNSENWLYIIISLVVFNYIFSTVLNFINNKYWRDEIPPIMKNYYNKEKYIKAKKYAKEKGKINLISNSLNTLITLIFLTFKGYGFLNLIISNYYEIPFLQSSIFFSNLIRFN